MTFDGNIQLINQICAKSGLTGKELENLRTNLSALSKQELQEELIKFLVAQQDDSRKGLEVETENSLVLLDSYQKANFYDKKGNVITEYRDGDRLIERIIKGKDDEGNEIETIITYRNNRPFTIAIKKNGQQEAISSYTYHEKSDTNFIAYVTVETQKSDNTTVSSDVLSVDDYWGNFDNSKVTERVITYPDGRVTTITKILNVLVEIQKRTDKTTLTTYYVGTDIEAYENKQLFRAKQTIQKDGQLPQELRFDGEGNTIVTVNAGDGWNALAKRFHTTPQAIKDLNPKVKSLKAGQDILIPGEFDIESKEIAKVQPREEAIVEAWNAEVDRQIAEKVTEGMSSEDAKNLKQAGVKPTAENYNFYQKFSKLNPSQKQNVLSMIKYHKAQGVTDLNEIKEKILETYPNINLFDSGKFIRFFNNPNTGITYFDRLNTQSKAPVSLETYLTKYLKLDIKNEPGKKVYERLASITQENLDKINTSILGEMSGFDFYSIAQQFLNAGLNICTQEEYNIIQTRNNIVTYRSSSYAEAEREKQAREKTLEFAYQLIHKARLQLDAYLAELKDHYIKNFGSIVWEGLKSITTLLLPDSWTSGSGEYEALVKNISVKSANLYVLEGDILRLKGNVNAADFEEQYKKLLKTDYKPEKIEKLMALAQNPPAADSPDYEVYEKQMETAIKDVTGKNFTENVTKFISWSKGAGTLVETAIFCYVTAGMGTTVNIGGQTARAVTVAGKTYTTATRTGAAIVMATNFGRYAAVRSGLNFIDDIDNLLAPMTLEERLRGRKDLTLGGMFVGENNADQIRESLSAIKDWATGKITREEVDKIIKKSFKNLSFDDFVSSNGGQWVLNTVTSSIFGAVAGYATPWFTKAGEIGTKWGQHLGLNAPNIQEVTAKLIAENPAGLNAAEFMAKTYEALHATNIVGKGFQFLVETAVFYCTNLPLSLIQETLSESNGELEKAFNEGRLGSYLISRFGEEALNLLKVKSIGTIIAMMMGTTNIAQLKENFEDYDVLKNTTIRYEDATIQNPDGTFTSGKAVVLEGPTGKLYVDGSSAKFYTAAGQLVVSESLGAEAQFMEMNEGVKTTFLLGKFMQIERYVKTLQNPVEDAVDLSMPYKPSAQEQQVQIAIDQIAGQNQRPQTPSQAIVTPTSNHQPAVDNNGTQAVEIPLTPPDKKPYQTPSTQVIDIGPQQMVAASGPQPISERQRTQTTQTAALPAPLTDVQKTDLHERLQEIAQALAANNYANIDILNNLTEDERKDFTDNVLHIGSGRVHDDFDFLFFVSGEKPAVLLGGISEKPEEYLDKLKSDNVDVFHRVVTFGNGEKRNNTLLINKQMAKSVIEDNKELFQKRLGLSDNATVDEIYEKLISEDSILKDQDESSDLTGLILGYPKYNTMIFRLDKWIEDNNIMTKVEMRRNPDIEKYKSALKQALQAEDSPYKDMSDEFKNTLSTKIDEITEVTPSRILFNNDSDGYVFNYTTPEPEELVRIEQSMLHTAEKTQSVVQIQPAGTSQGTNNPNNLTSVNTPQEAGARASQALADSRHRIATAGYSQNSPEGYEDTARGFLQALENELGDNNTAYVTSPTTQKGSIDAITTEVEGLKDGTIFYTTSQNYINYIGTDNPAIDTQAYQQVTKHVLPDAASYSEATAAASNTFIAIGGKNTTVSDFVNAIKYGNKAVILASAKLGTPAWDSENGTVGNASKYIAEQIQAVRDGKELPYPEVGNFTRQFIEENLDKFNSTLKIITTDGNPESLQAAAKQAALFLAQEEAEISSANQPVSQTSSENEPVQLTEGIDWLSFKADRTKVTQVLLRLVPDKAEFEKFKTSKGYETDEDAIIPFLKRLRIQDPNFKLSEEAKDILSEFTLKYNIDSYLFSEFDIEYLTNYKQTSYRYQSKHEASLHDLTTRTILDIRNKFGLDTDENFDLEKLNENLENLPTETLDLLRKMFSVYEIQTKEDALRILSSDFSKWDIKGIRKMLRANNSYSAFALAEFAFSTPEEFEIKKKRLVERKADLPENCEFDTDKKLWHSIINMSDEDFAYYKNQKSGLPEGITSDQLQTYKNLMAQDPELTTTLLEMKSRKWLSVGRNIPRFTVDDIAKLFEAVKIDREFTLELINKQKEKGGLLVDYKYNDVDDIVKFVELTQKYDKEEVKRLVNSENNYDPEDTEKLLALKAQDQELYELCVKNQSSVLHLDELDYCMAKNPVLTKELLQNAEYSIPGIKTIIDCNEKHPEITKYLFEIVERDGNQEDRFTPYEKTNCAEYVLNCNKKQLKYFMECLEARKPDGSYRFSHTITDICKLHEEHPKELKEMLDYRFKDESTGEEKCLLEGVITVMMPCYIEDKATALEAINTDPSMSCYCMLDLYKLLRSPYKETVRKLLAIKNTNGTQRRFSVIEIIDILPIIEDNPAEFEEMLNAKTIRGGRVEDAYDSNFIKNYQSMNNNLVKHLMDLTITGNDGNEYKLLSGTQIIKIQEAYNDKSIDKNGLDEIIYNPKYKILLTILSKDIAPLLCNPQFLTILEENGIENAKGLVLTNETEGQRILILTDGKTKKTINLNIDKDNNITVTGDETAYKRDDKNLIRRNFEDGSYLVEEISYVDAPDGDGGKTKIAYDKMKTWYDSNGIQTRSEVITPVEGEPGEFTINVYERGLNKQMVKKSAGTIKITEDDEGHSSKVEKTLTAPDGTVTRQTKTNDPTGTSSTYEITKVENGETKVLFSQTRSHVKLDENHYTSSLDGQIYDMKFSNDGITVSKLDDEGKPFETITLGTDVLDPELFGIFKQLPGDVFFLINKIGIKKISIRDNIKENAQYIYDTNSIEISREFKNDAFVFMHELYHGVSFIMFGLASGKKEYSDTYNSDLNNYQANSANQEEQIAGYFSSRYHGTESGPEEAFAEIGAIVSGVDIGLAANETLGMRSLIVQQNLAQTIAVEMNMIQNGMTQPLPPRISLPGVTMVRINENSASPQGVGTTNATLTPKQIEIQNLLQRDLKNFGDFNEALQKKIIMTLEKLEDSLNTQPANLFKGILAYIGEPELIEKICDNNDLLSEINQNAQDVHNIFRKQPDIDTETRNQVFFNLLMMKYFYPENYGKLSESDGFQQISAGKISINTLQNLKYNDNLNTVKNILEIANSVTQTETNPIQGINQNSNTERISAQEYNYTSPEIQNPPLSRTDKKKLAARLQTKLITNPENLTDAEILYLWSYRYYDSPRVPQTNRLYFMQRFNSLCEKHNINTKPNEVLLRTIAAAPSIDKDRFTIGKPVDNNNCEPAAAARIQWNGTGEIPVSLKNRIIEDKKTELVREYAGNIPTPIPESTLYIIENPSQNSLKGFDWAQMGSPKEKGFGSLVFKREVDEEGKSTEVNFPADTEFCILENSEIETIDIPITIDNIETSFKLNIVHIKPI